MQLHPSPAARPLALGLGLTLALASTVPAQIGPFTDGEILAYAPSPSAGGGIYRIDPVTGAGAVLVDNLYSGYHEASFMAYDPYRDGVLAYTSYTPIATFQPRLYMFPSDGSVVELGFVLEELSSLTPVGDGRVYLRRDGILHYLDAQDQLHLVPDHNGMPVDLEVHHLVYEPNTHSLIGVANSQSSVPCAQFKWVTVHKLPLNASGDQLAGPVVCSSYDAGSAQSPVGIDTLPGGDVVIVYTGGGQFTDEVLLRVDPVSLTISNWAPSSLNDIDGGFWSGALQRVVVEDDVTDELRTYAPGQSGAGLLLPIGVSLWDGTSGASEVNSMTEVRLMGSGCGGHGVGYGSGLTGTGGIEPRLIPTSCATIDTSIQLGLRDLVGGAPGLLALTAAPTSVPLYGGTLLVQPPLLWSMPFLADGPLSAAGAGEADILLTVPNNPSLIGIEVYLQAGALDSGAAQGISLTAGLALGIG